MTTHRGRAPGRTRLLVAGLAVAVAAGCGPAATRHAPRPSGSPRTGSASPAQPHRAAAHFPRPGPGQPRWDVPGHHWVGLSTAWKAANVPGSRKEEVPAQLTSDGKRVIFERAGVLAAYDGATGRRLWRERIGWHGSAATIVAGGGVTVASRRSDSSWKGALGDCVAYDTATGARRWRIPDCQTETDPDGLPYRGVFYYAHGGPHGEQIIDVDTATGERRYAHALVGDDKISGLVPVNGRIMATADRWSGNVDSAHHFVTHVLPPDLRTCATVRLTGENDLPAPPLVSGNVVVVRGGNQQDRIRRVDPHTGRALAPAWTAEPPGGDDGSMTVGVLGRTLMTTTGNGRAYGLSGYDLLTGARLWSTPVDLKWPAYEIEDGTLFGLGNGVAIIDPATGRIVFQHPAAKPGRGAFEQYSHAVAVGRNVVVYDHDGLTGYR